MRWFVINTPRVTNMTDQYAIFLIKLLHVKRKERVLIIIKLTVFMHENNAIKYITIYKIRDDFYYKIEIA